MTELYVPKMSLSQHTLKRLSTIQQGLREGLSREQIGANCKVTEKTIDRDMQEWVQSGLFEVWLKTEFVTLHSYAVGANPLEAYKEVAKIVARMVTQKRELKEEITETKTVNYNVNYSEEDKLAVLDAYRRITNKENSSPTQPPSLH